MIDPSEVVWKPKRETAGATAGWASDNSNLYDLRQIPVDEVTIEAASRIVVHTDPRSPGADRFRYLRMRLREARELTKLRSVMITSPLPEDGKSTVSLNLATALTEGGKRNVLLIDADLHHPTLAERLGLEPRKGLAECLEDGLSALSLLRRIEPLHWYFMHAGTPRGNPTEALQPEAFTEMMKVFSYYFDWIIIDTPPIVPISDTLLLSKCVDTTLLVARADRTPRDAIQEAVTRLGPKNLLGIVLNGAERLNRIYSQYHGYYGNPKKGA